MLGQLPRPINHTEIGQLSAAFTYLSHFISELHFYRKSEMSPAKSVVVFFLGHFLNFLCNSFGYIDKTNEIN